MTHACTCHPSKADHPEEDAFQLAPELKRKDETPALRKEFTDTEIGRVVFEWNGKNWRFVEIIRWTEENPSPPTNSYYRPLSPLSTSVFRNPNDYQTDND
jgi:hypothetical protein